MWLQRKACWRPCKCMSVSLHAQSSATARQPVINKKPIGYVSMGIQIHTCTGIIQCQVITLSRFQQKLIYSCFSVIFNRRNVLLKITPQCSSLRWLYLDDIPSVENFHTQTCKIMVLSSLFWLPRVPKHTKWL